MAVFTMVGTAKNEAICKVVNVMEILCFYENFFVLRKGSFPS